MTNATQDSLIPYRRRAHKRLFRRRFSVYVLAACTFALAMLILAGIRLNSFAVLGQFMGNTSQRGAAVLPSPTARQTQTSTATAEPSATPIPPTAEPSATPIPPTAEPPTPTIEPTSRSIVDQIESRTAPVVIVVDGSNSMNAQLEGSGQTRIDAARTVLDALISQLPDGRPIDVWAFGTVGDNTAAGRAISCVAGVSLNDTGDRERARAALNAIFPRGWTPIGQTLDAIAAQYTAGSLDVVLVSDGRETCDGDPVVAARTLIANNSAERRLIVVAVSVDEADEASLRAIADAAAGQYIAVNDEASLRAALLGNDEP
jgi:Mg-chelatase subunit ChlD